MNSTAALLHRRTAALLLTALMGCTSNQTSGAAQGAAYGGLGGAAAGALSALVFGGDVAASAARGAVWAGTTGAVGGALAGTNADRREAQEQRVEADRELERLREEIGDDAYDGLGALAECKHGVALAYAKTAAASKNADHTLAAVWLEALTYLDARQMPEAQALYPQIVERDQKVSSVEQAAAGALEVLETIRDFREREGMARTCE